MTCIAALIDKNNDIYIGGDSCTFSDNHYELPPYPKAYIKKGVAFGFSGIKREAQIIRYSFDPPDFKNIESLMNYMCIDFVDELKSNIEKRFQLNKETDSHSGSCLVCMHGHIFSVGSDFSITERSDTFDAIGSGKNYALGALHSTQDWDDGEARIRHALETAEKFSSSCRAPFHILYLKSSENEDK